MEPARGAALCVPEIQNNTKNEYTDVVTNLYCNGSSEQFSVRYLGIGQLFDRRLTEIEAKRVTMQLLEGLSYLHSKGIVHCDIKPQNLLFAPDPASPDAANEKAPKATTSEEAAAGERTGSGSSGGSKSALLQSR